MRLLVALAFLASCAPQGYGPWWYQDVTAYHLQAPYRTPHGVRFWAPDKDVPGLAERLDRQTEALETCLGTTIRRDWFTVYVPPDWYVSACSGEQLFPSAMPCQLCRDKGLVISDECCKVIKPTAACPCPCSARATLQGDSVITVPNLKLYKAELTRLVTGAINPWIVPTLARCLQ